MVVNLYSKRQKQARGEVSDVYIYDSFPEQFRMQVVYLWKKGLGEIYSSERVTQLYQETVSILREEYGVAELASGWSRQSEAQELYAFILQEQNPERVLDAIELSLKLLNGFGRNYAYRRTHDFDETADRAISDLNIRFKEHSLGFEFTNNEIIRIDSQLIHAEVVKPTLKLLHQPHLKGAEDEYLQAHEHFRHGNHKEAINECLKAFESTMKGICKKRGWEFDEKKATASTLIEICYKNELIPSFWQSQMAGLRSLLEGGLPTARNRLGGHGQGEVPVAVPEHIVAYMMHMTASTLKFLADADAAMA